MQEAEKRKLGEQAEVAEQVANLRRELMIRALVQEEIAGKVKVEDKDVQEYYAAHPDEFSGDTVRLRHILVQTEGEAKEIQARLAKNESFEELAKKLSRDTNSAPKGGDLGYLGREQMLPDFARAAFALKANEVSDVVKTPFGFHLIRLVDRKKGEPLAFDQVRGSSSGASRMSGRANASRPGSRSWKPGPRSRGTSRCCRWGRSGPRPPRRPLHRRKSRRPEENRDSARARRVAGPVAARRGGAGVGSDRAEGG
jgi:hypothetical protein